MSHHLIFQVLKIIDEICVCGRITEASLPQRIKPQCQQSRRVNILKLKACPGGKGDNRVRVTHTGHF